MSTAISETDQGVYYQSADSPGFIIRLLIDLLDLILLIILTAATLAGLTETFPPGSAFREAIPPLIFLMWWSYLVLLKWSRIGTLGYGIFRVRTVDLHARPAGILRLTLRALLCFIFNPLFDLIYLTVNPSRQALRDKLSGTYVIKRRAQPAGQGRLIYARVFFLGYAMMYREVDRR